MKLTKPQLAALRKYADGKAVDINPKVFHNICDMGLIERTGGYYTITKYGLGVLDANEMPVYDGRNRMIVAAPTKKAAHAAMQAVMPCIGTLKTWNNWTADTGNDEECRIARAKPLTVFTKSDGFNKHDTTFKEMVPR